jgi:hypothetical protein
MVYQIGHRKEDMVDSKRVSVKERTVTQSRSIKSVQEDPGVVACWQDHLSEIG